jgi:hypothetical protein
MAQVVEHLSSKHENKVLSSHTTTAKTTKKKPQKAILVFLICKER